MLRERARLLTTIHKGLDICLTTAAFIASYFIKKYLLPEPFRGLTIAPNYYIILLLIIIIWYLTFHIFNVYSSYRSRSFGHIFMEMLKVVSISMVILITLMFIGKITRVSRIMLTIFFILDIGLLVSSKGLVYYILAQYRKKGYNFRNVLIIGSKERAKEVIDQIKEQQGSGFKVIGCLENDVDLIGRTVTNGIKIIGPIDSLELMIRKEVVDEVIFAMPLKIIENAGEYIYKAEEMGVSVRIVPDWQIHRLKYKPSIASIQIEDFLGVPTIAFHTTPSNHAELFIKSTIDYIFAVLAGVILLPLIGIIAGAIKLSSQGPVLFSQERSGLNGRKFKLYKFRTMIIDAEKRRGELYQLDEADGPVFKIRNDPRIIPYVGTFLRKSGLDELPQLINVLKGEMSLVGPRPPIPVEVENYNIWQRRRLSMKPGITCLWQISQARNDVSFNEWMKMDLQYIDNWSLFLDFKIILRTVGAVFTAQGR